jgi:hypothetical protein
LSEHGPQDGVKHLSCGIGSTFFHGSFPFFRQFLSCNLFAFYGKNQLLSSTLFHAKAQSSQRKTKIKFLRILASLRLCERILFGSGIEQYIISRKGAKLAKENKDKFFKNLGVFAPLRENLIWFRLVRFYFLWCAIASLY